MSISNQNLDKNLDSYQPDNTEREFKRPRTDKSLSLQSINQFNLQNLPLDIWSIVFEHLLDDQYRHPLYGHPAYNDFRNLIMTCTSFHNENFIKQEKVHDFVNLMASRAITKISREYNEVCDLFEKQITRELINSVDSISIFGGGYKLLNIISKFDFSNLKKLNILSNSMEDPNCDLLPISIESLECNYKNLNDNSIANLSHLTNLTCLNTSIPQETRSPLKGSTFHLLPISMKSLQCPNANLNDKGIAKLAHLTNLTYLNIYFNTEVTGSTFSLLPIPIKCLDINGTKTDDKGIANLAHLTNLETLDYDVSRHGWRSGSTFNLLPNSIKHLRCGNTLSDENIIKLTHLTNLKKLELSFNYELTGSTFKLLPISIKLLKCDYNTKINDEGIANLAHLTNLTYLDIFDSGGRRITGSTFKSLASSLKVIVSGTGHLSDEILLDLANRNVQITNQWNRSAYSIQVD